MKELYFTIVHPSETAAGLLGYSEEITIIIDSGNPGGEPGEFEAYMCGCLAEWFDGAAVTCVGRIPHCWSQASSAPIIKE